MGKNYPKCRINALLRRKFLMYFNMKKLTFLCVAVMVTAALIFKAENSFSQVYQLENGDFEDWPGSATTEPTGWNSFPSASCELPWPLSIAGCGTATATRHERSTEIRPGATGYCCKIYATSALNITANGALTSGLMHLASTTASDHSNCNETKTDDDEFNHRLNAKPDSIVFWAKVVNADANSEACCHLYIHDNYNLKDPLGANSNGYESHIVGGVPSYNFTNTTGGVAYDDSGWRRHSTPIIYEGYTCNDPQFVLITFSTNAIPGGGSANDALYIDDIEFIYNPIRHQFTESACGHYTWDGTEYTESGDYTKTYDIAGPRDSIVTLHLTINQPTANEIYESACGSYPWNNNTYTESGTYTGTFSAANGCDSVVTLHLTINQPVTNEITETACGIYTWGEESYTASNDYTQTFTAANGCDSVVTLHLTITEAPSREENVTACDHYTWYEQDYTESGDFYHTIDNAEGCDSLITLHLTINNSTSNEITETACSSFSWNGETYTTSGTYTETFQAANGCDSIVTLHLTINQPVAHEITETACGSFSWNGETYTTSGTYTETFQAANGCDSVVTLHLTINQPVAHEITETACGNFTWNDSIYTESGNYTQTLSAANGCDSVVTLHLTITEAPNREVSETACDSYTWYEQEYTESGNYQHTVENAEGCDSLITLHLTINESVRYEFDTSANESFTWNNETYTTSGDYVQTLSTVNNCDSVVTLHLTITTVGIDENEMSEINVYPVPAKDMLNIEGEGIKSVKISDILGKEIAEYINDGEATMSISVDNFKSGSYLLVIKKESGNTITRRIAIMK